MPTSPIEYLSVTFLQDMTFGPTLVPKGTTTSLQKDFARGIGSGVKVNGPGSATDASVLGSAAVPASVSGLIGAGNTLTASPNPGWTIGGYQWNRNGSPISGATSTTYVQSSQDNNATLSLTVTEFAYTITVGGSILVTPPAPSPSPTPSPSPSPTPSPAPTPTPTPSPSPSPTPTPAPSPTPTPAPAPSPSGPSITIPITFGAKQFSLTSASTAVVPFTIGFAFAKGDVPTGFGVVADKVTNLQVTPMNAWPDGSLKFAVLAGAASLTAGDEQIITLLAGTSATGTALTTTNLKATSITASIACGSFGTVSWATTDWDAPFATHVSGPQMSSWIYRKAVGADAHLVAWLEVRLFAGGAVEVLPWIENGYIHVASPQTKSATFAFTLGGTQRFSQALAVGSRTRTPLINGTATAYWLGTDPALLLRHDTDYLQSTEVVPPYQAVVDPSNAMITANPALTYAPFQQGGFQYGSDAMGGTGFANPIGLLPQHDVLYLTCDDPSLYNTVVRNGFSAGRYGIHYRDEATNRPIKFSAHPNLSNNQSSTSDLAAADASPIAPTWELGHHPSVGYMAYLLTGRFYFMEEVQFAATANYISQVDTYRGFAAGYVEPVGGGVAVRQVAWSLRTLATAINVCPDSDTSGLQAEFANTWNAIALRYHARYIEDTSGTGSVNPLGFIEDNLDYWSEFGNSGQIAAITGWMGASWMHDFCVASFGWAIAAGMPVTSDTQAKLLDFFVNYYGRCAVGRLGSYADWQAGTAYLFTEAAPYNMAMTANHTVHDNSSRDTSGQPWLPSPAWNSSYQMTKLNASFYPTGSPSQTPFFENSNTLHQISLPPAGGYFSNLVPAISYAVRHGVAGAADAYSRLTGAIGWSVTDPSFGSSMVASFNTDSPVWAVRPLLAPQPAWLRSQPLNAWFTISGTTQQGSAADVQGGLSVDGRLAYSGLALKDAELWQCADGGHTDYSGNEVVSCDLSQDSPTWRLRCAASTVIGTDVYYEADGKPAAAHRYWAQDWAPQVNRIVLPYTRFTSPNATSSPATNGFDPLTNTWDAQHTWADGTLSNCIDEDGNFWAIGVGGNQIQKFTPSTNTWVTVATAGHTITGAPSVFDSKRKNIFTFCFGDGQGDSITGDGILTLNSHVIDRVTGAVTTITFNTSAALTQLRALLPAYASLDYDPVGDRFLFIGPANNSDSYGGSGGATIYAITPNSGTVWDVSILAVSGLTPPRCWGAGSFNRFRFVRSLGSLVYMPSGTDPLYCLKLYGEVSSTPVPPPSPTPSPAPSPTPTPAPSPSPYPGLIFLAKMDGSTLVDVASGMAITSGGVTSYDASSPGPAWQFGGANGDALSVASFTGSITLPLTMGCFWRQTGSLATGVVLGGIAIDSSKYLLLQADQFGNISATAWGASVTSSGTVANNTHFAYNAWQMCAAVFTGTTSRQAYATGAGLGAADTTSVDMSGSTAKLVMGAFPNSFMNEAITGFEKIFFVISGALDQAHLDAIAADPTILVPGAPPPSPAPAPAPTPTPTPAPSPTPTPAPAPAPTPTPAPAPAPSPAPAGATIRLTTLGSAVVESGDSSTGWKYAVPSNLAGAAVDDAGTEFGVSAASMAVDGSATVVIGTLTKPTDYGGAFNSDVWDLNCGLDPSASNIGDSSSSSYNAIDYPISIHDNGTYADYRNVHGALNGTSTVAAAGDWLQFRVAPSTLVVTAYVSKNSGSTWVLIHTFPTAATAPLFFHYAGSRYCGVSAITGVGFSGGTPTDIWDDTTTWTDSSTWTD